MSTNFAASTHEFPEVDVVPVTELERIPKRNWDFCPMARSPMARPSLLLSAKRMHIAPSCEIVNRPWTLCRMRPRDIQYICWRVHRPTASRQTDGASILPNVRASVPVVWLEVYGAARHGHSDYYHGHGGKPLCSGVDGTWMPQHFWAVGRSSPVNARDPEDRDSA